MWILCLLYNRFYRVGGGTRLAGCLLAGCTALLLLVGTAPIGYIREDFVAHALPFAEAHGDRI